MPYPANAAHYLAYKDDLEARDEKCREYCFQMALDYIHANLNDFWLDLDSPEDQEPTKATIKAWALARKICPQQAATIAGGRSHNILEMAFQKLIDKQVELYEEYF